MSCSRQKFVSINTIFFIINVIWQTKETKTHKHDTKTFDLEKTYWNNTARSLLEDPFISLLISLKDGYLPNHVTVLFACSYGHCHTSKTYRTSMNVTAFTDKSKPEITFRYCQFLLSSIIPSTTCSGRDTYKALARQSASVC